ncbi:MAG: hypothetical protein IMW89_08400 [Ktedonobacteraceae bacterium]|nr:hypothetical protein [Ktedonobacteraceae bacterium]
MFYFLLMLGSGIFWTITYILVIRRSFLDRTYGMPLVALCANLSWELIFAFIYPPLISQRIVNLVWLSLDVIVLFLTLRYGPREFPDLSKPAFYTMFSIALLAAFALVLLISLEFHDRSGAYTAFGQNLMMSALFIAMLYRRHSTRGQSLAIGICKLIGTALASLAFYLHSVSFRHSVLLPFLYIAILVFDLFYVVMLYRQMQVERYEKGKAVAI